MLHLWMRVVFTIIAFAQLAIIFSNIVTAIQADSQLGYLSIIDLIFPIIGLVAVWKFQEEEREPSDKRCMKMHALMLVYLAWCVIWVIVGTILVLARAHVFTYADTSAAVAFLGDPTQPVNWTSIKVSCVQIGFEFLGIVIASICYPRMTEHKKQVQSGFV